MPFRPDVVATAEDGDIGIVDVDGSAATRVTRGPAVDWGLIGYWGVRDRAGV